MFDRKYTVQEARWPHRQCTRLWIELSRFEPWLGTLCCVLGQDTLLSQYISPPRFTKMGAGNLMLGEPCDGLASNPGGSRNTTCCFMLRKPEISTGLMGHLVRMRQTRYLTCCTVHCKHFLSQTIKIIVIGVIKTCFKCPTTFFVVFMIVTTCSSNFRSYLFLIKIDNQYRCLVESCPDRFSSDKERKVTVSIETSLESFTQT